VVDGLCVFHDAPLLCEFLIEGEHSTFLFAVQVAGAATPCGEVGVGWRRRKFDEGGWPGSVRARSDVLGVDAGDVACAAATSVVVVAGGDGGVWLGDLVGWHFDGVV